MIWLIGNRGMLGTDVELLLKKHSMAYISSDLEVDITASDALEAFVSDQGISWIINCSAYTAVDKAEEEQEKAFFINIDGVHNIAKLALQNDSKLIHISTDYVFDGEKDKAYTESDKENPTGVYGTSKLEGERKIKQTLDTYFILRTSWLYGQYGKNFVHTMLRLFKEKDELKVVNDQFGSPTYSLDLASVIVHIIRNNSDQFGIYHFSNEGRTSWYDFAREIYRIAKGVELVDKDISIHPVPTSEYPTPAKRPADSYMSKEKIKSVLGVKLRSWQDALEEFLKTKVGKK